MQRVKFFLTPLNNNRIDDLACIEKKILRYCDTIEYILDKEDILSIPTNFYSGIIVQAVPIAEYLFNDDYASDLRDLLFEHITKINTEDISYGEIFEKIDLIKFEEKVALLGMHENMYIKEMQLYINRIEQWVNPHRYYLAKARTVEEFIEYCQVGFPNLHFHPRVKNTMRALQRFHEHIEELIRHLIVLNDNVKLLYDEYGATSDEVYRRMGSEYNIIASGRGSNEGLEQYVCEFKNSEGNDEQVRCNPHTKLYTKHSDYRIYFNWGRPNIQNGKILIGHIGNHWV